MKRLKGLLFLLLLSSFLISLPLEAGYSLIDGKWCADQYAPQYPVQEHYDLGYQQIYRNEWDEALKNFMTILYHFEDSPFYTDSLFYSGICYYFNGDLDLADEQFSRYLNSGGNLKHFQKVFEFKYEIAEYYRKGVKRHLLGYAKLPKIMPAKGNAIKLYDEIVASLPSHEIAAKALFSKAKLQRSKRQYKDSIETLQTLTRYFPKHALAAESYLAIGEIYLKESQVESQNPDLISLAAINLQRFKKSFPGDERYTAVEKLIVEMQEVYANSLFETGRFYERKKRPHASLIYYRDAIHKYPKTPAADKSRERIVTIESSSKTIAVK